MTELKIKQRIITTLVS